MTRRDRELAVVVAAALLIALPFLCEGFHVDEPFFLDRARDLVVFAKTTTNFRPTRPRRVNAERRVVSCRIPLRLISGFGGEGGFYSNISGFLPFSPSAEPVEEFTVVESL